MWKEGKTLSHPLIFRVTPILQKRAGRRQPFVPQMRGVMVSTCNDGETPARPSKAPVTPPGADRRRLLQTANRLKPIQQERLEALLRLGPVLREISIFHISAAGKLRVRPSFDKTECSDLGGGVPINPLPYGLCSRTRLWARPPTPPRERGGWQSSSARDLSPRSAQMGAANRCLNTSQKFVPKTLQPRSGRGKLLQERLRAGLLQPWSAALARVKTFGFFITKRNRQHFK